VKAGSRIRSIKPEWLDDEKLAACSDGARVLSIAVILVADDHGCGRANHTWLSGIAWTYHDDPDRPRRVAEFLRELETCGFIRTYMVRGQRYYEIVNWRKHQRCDNAGKRRVPGPDEEDPSGSTGGSAPVQSEFAETRGEPPNSSAQSAARARSLSVSISGSGSDSASEISADEEPVDKRMPGARSLVDARLKHELLKAGLSRRETSSTWAKAIDAILDFLDKNPGRRSDEVIVSAVTGFKANRKAGDLGWPLSYFAQNILEYLDKAPRAPVTRDELDAAGGTKTMNWGEAKGEPKDGRSEGRRDDEDDDG